MIVSDYRLFKIKQTIKNKYLEEGYLLAEINIDTSAVSPNIVNIDIVFSDSKHQSVVRFHLCKYWMIKTFCK